MFPSAGLSCRKSHRESSTGGYTPPLNKDGDFIERKGYLVGCNNDLDCYSRCGETPTHGSPYVCSLNLTLYTHAGHNEGVATELEANAAQLAATGQSHQKIVRHPRDDSFYMVTEPGDDTYDVNDGSAGVCTDVHVAYGNTGCTSNGASKAIMTVGGAVGRYTGWSKYLCGALIEHGDSDFVTGSSISLSSLVYPRTLVNEAQVNGHTEGRVTCWNPSNCMSKCDFFSKNARDNGLPSPAACSLCNPPIPDNTVTTIVTLISAIRDDIASAMRLVAICLNPKACACQVLMMLKPAWLANLQSPVEKCSSASDVISLIMDRIMVNMVRTAEGLVNGLIKSVNKVIRSFGGNLKAVCWEYKTFKRCPEDADSLSALFGCSPDHDEPHRRCYYEYASYTIKPPTLEPQSPTLRNMDFKRVAQASEVDLHGQGQSLQGLHRPVPLTHSQ